MTRSIIVALVIIISITACQATKPTKKTKSTMNFCLDRNGKPIVNRDRGEVTPIIKLEPIYPIEAYTKQMEGFVDISFSINTEGRPYDLSVVNANQNTVFNEEALKAFAKRLYRPDCKNGTASNTKFINRVNFILPKAK